MKSMKGRLSASLAPLLVLAGLGAVAGACASEPEQSAASRTSEDELQVGEEMAGDVAVERGGAGEEELAEQEVVAVPSDITDGVDVSHYSGGVDWARVRDAGYGFAYVKATEGVDSADLRFAEHWDALGKLGLLRGAYHFYVTEDDPEEQARFFLETVDHRAGDLAPAVDLEVLGRGTRPGLAARVRRFLEIVEAELGVRPILYTSPNFWDAHLDEDFGDYPLWLAEYGVAEPTLPRGWDGYLLWQWKGDAPVPGIEKGADLSRVHQGDGLSPLVIQEL